MNTTQLLASNHIKMVIEQAESALNNCKKYFIAMVAADGKKLSTLTPELQNDKDIVLAAVRNAPESLEYASDRLKADREVVFTATRGARGLWDHVDNCLKRDKSFLLEVLQYDVIAWRFAKLFDVVDQEIILEAVLLHPALCAETKYTAEVAFVYQNYMDIKKHEWPLIKLALLNNPDDFLRPPESIRCLSHDNDFKLFAEYALNKNVQLCECALPDLSM